MRYIPALLAASLLPLGLTPTAGIPLKAVPLPARVHISTAPPTMTVSISGPSSITAAGSYTWTVCLHGSDGFPQIYDLTLYVEQGTTATAIGNMNGAYDGACTSGSLNISAGSALTLLGAVWGLDSNNNWTIRASTTYGVSINIPSPPALSVTISGPSEVRPFAECEWSGSASDGTSPYGYNWDNGYSYDQYFDYTNGSNNGESFTLTLKATDALGAQGTVTKQVQVSTSAPACAG